MNKIKYPILVFALSLLFSIHGFAAEKELSVDLVDGYSQADFYFSFMQEQNYTVTITDPKGNENSTVIVGLEGSISITELSKGTYDIRIESEGDVEMKTSPRVELIKSSASSTKAGISVSSNVSNLVIWFDNGKFNAKWDDTVGKVNIQITNPSTMEVIANTTVNDTKYSCKINPDVENINFYIVPSNSSKIEGAGSSYSIAVVRDVPGEISFPEKTIYNTFLYSFTATLYGNTTISVSENNSVIKEEFFQNAGIYSISIPLNDIENKIYVDVIDEKGNINTYMTSVKKDVEAPKFVIPVPQEVTKDSSVTINGTVTEVSMVEINENPIEVSSSGQFTYTYPLQEGDNKIVISAEDEAGNRTTNEYTITRVVVSYGPIYIAIGFVFIVVLCVVMIFKKKGNVQFPLILKHENTQKECKKDSEDKKERKSKHKKKADRNSKKTSLIEKRAKNDIIGNSISIGVFAICLIILLSKGILITTVMSGSMEPTLKVGNYVIYNRLSYMLHEIERGDIVCFYLEEAKKTYAKRVIGLPGDEISFADGYLIINGKKVEEPYIDSSIETNSVKSFIVPEGKVFLLGDNRNNSADSRFWDEPFVDEKFIYGKFIGQIRNIF